MDTKPRVGILLVTYNQYNITAQFVRSYMERFACDPDLYLLVLDNDSDDSTFEKLKAEFPALDVRLLNANYGCVTGRNIGIVLLEAIGCKYVYISDNDILIEDEKFFKRLLDFHEQYPYVDASSPKVLWSDNRSVQTLGTIRVFGSLTRNSTVSKGVQRMASLPGCAQFIKIEAFKRYGLYDNDFTPVSIEDYEWGIRANSLGAILVNYPDVYVVHLRERNREDTRATKIHYLSGRVKYLRKHFSLLRLLYEIWFSAKNVRHYGLRTIFQGYATGLKARLHRYNYSYKAFIDAGMERYYKSKSTTNGAHGS